MIEVILVIVYFCGVFYFAIWGGRVRHIAMPGADLKEVDKYRVASTIGMVVGCLLWPVLWAFKLYRKLL